MNQLCEIGAHCLCVPMVGINKCCRCEHRQSTSLNTAIPRPSEPKRLADVIRQYDLERGKTKTEGFWLKDSSYYDKVADISIKHFEEKLEWKEVEEELKKQIELEMSPVWHGHIWDKNLFHYQLTKAALQFIKERILQ